MTGAAAREQPIVFHGGALGDLALTIQLMLMLEPRATALTVVSRVDPGDLSAFHPPVRRLSHEALATHWLHGPRSVESPQALRDFVAGRFVLQMLSTRDSAVHEALAALGPAALYSIDPRPRGPMDTHITEQWRADLELQGLRFADSAIDRCRLDPPSEDRVADIERDEVIVAPGSGGRAKCWPLANFVAVASALADAGLPVRFLIGPVEVERWQPADIKRLARQFAVTRYPTPSELIGLLRGARGLIGNDSGTSHLAALLDTPTATIFGPTSARQWRPLARSGIAIQGDAATDAADWGLDLDAVAARLLDWLNRPATAGPRAQSCG